MRKAKATIHDARSWRLFRYGENDSLGTGAIGASPYGFRKTMRANRKIFLDGRSPDSLHANRTQPAYWRALSGDTCNGEAVRLSSLLSRSTHRATTGVLHRMLKWRPDVASIESQRGDRSFGPLQATSTGVGAAMRDPFELKETFVRRAHPICPHAKRLAAVGELNNRHLGPAGPDNHHVADFELRRLHWMSSRASISNAQATASATITIASTIDRIDNRGSALRPIHESRHSAAIRPRAFRRRKRRP